MSEEPRQLALVPAHEREPMVIGAHERLGEQRARRGSPFLLSALLERGAHGSITSNE
jgi:hypothetical protein